MAWRRGPLLRAVIQVGPDPGAVVLEPGPRRWPEHEDGDRACAVLALAAITLARIEPEVAPGVRAALRDLAHELSASDRGDVVGPFGCNAPRPTVQRQVVLELRASSLGPAPSVGFRTPSSTTLVAAICALADGALVPATDGLRLAVALGLEGVLGYYRDADPRFQPPQQAVAFALQHVLFRFGQAGLEAPWGVALAAREQRRVLPMAGG